MSEKSKNTLIESMAPKPPRFKSVGTKGEFTAAVWDRHLSMGAETRMAVFDQRGWKYTVGLAVNGTVLSEDHPESSSRKRKAVSQPEPSTSSSNVSSEIFSRVESSLATLSCAVTSMNSGFNSLKDLVGSLVVQVDKLQGDVDEVKQILISFQNEEKETEQHDVDIDGDVEEDDGLFFTSKELLDIHSCVPIPVVAEASTVESLIPSTGQPTVSPSSAQLDVLIEPVIERASDDSSLGVPSST